MKAETKEKMTRKLRENVKRDVTNAELPPIYYDARSPAYWEKHGGKLTRVTREGVKARLADLGFSSDKKSGISEIDAMIIRIEREQQFVFGVDKLGGWPKGVYDFNSERLLIAGDTPFVTPTCGGLTLIKDFREKLYGADQARVRHAWTKLAIQARREGEARIREGKDPAWPIQQALCIVGEASHGKTLDATIDVYALTGSARGYVNPKQFNSGDTAFNEELAESCIHLLDDEEGRDDHNHRRAMGANIKQSVANASFRVHGKGKKPVTLDPLRRTMILLNDDLKDIRVLPDMDKGMGDKFILLKTVQKAVDPNDGHTYQTRRDAFLAAVSDYLGWLDTWEIPEEIKDPGGRYGVVSFHHSEVVGKLHELGAETHMIEFLKRFRGELKGEAWTAQQVFSGRNTPIRVNVTA